MVVRLVRKWSAKNTEQTKEVKGERVVAEVTLEAIPGK